MKADRAEQARRRLHGTGARLTRARVQVLSALLDAPRALTHHELEARVGRRARIDRVTIYRVLEWLTANGLAHRIAGEDRVWRYNAAEQGPEHGHPHFQCGRCGTVTCLERLAETPKVSLPAGYRSSGIALTVKGVCATCGPRDGAAARPKRAAHRH